VVETALGAKPPNKLPLPLLSSSISFSDAYSTDLELFTKWMLSNSKTRATKPFSLETTLAQSTFILRPSKRTTRSLLSSPIEPRCEVIHRTYDRDIGHCINFRNQAYIKTEAYGYAVADATKAIELNPKLVKVRHEPLKHASSNSDLSRRFTDEV